MLFALLSIPMHCKALKTVSHEMIKYHETKELQGQIVFFRLCMSLDLLVFRVHKYKYTALENLIIIFMGFFTF